MKKIKINNENTTDVSAVALSKPRALTYELTCSQTSWWSSQNSREKKRVNNENTSAGTGSGFEQAQRHQLWPYMLTIKLMVNSKLSWENKLLQGEKLLMVPAVALSKHRAITYELRSSETSWWSPKVQVKQKNLSRKNHCRYRQWLWASPGPSALSTQAQTQADGHPKIQVKRKHLSRKKPLPVPVVAFSKPRAISCELTCSQSSWWSAQNSREKKKQRRKYYCRYRQWLWASPRPWAVSSHAHIQAHW
jgi:hypothetical protein